MKQNRKHYSLYKKRMRDREVWYVRYWDPVQGRYSIHRSTGIEVTKECDERQKAEDIAISMLDSICINANKQMFIQYLENFWQPNSIYVQECAKEKGHKLTPGYIKSNADIVKSHIKPFDLFNNVLMINITPALIRKWKQWEIERGISTKRVNKALQTMRVPYHYAFTRNEIQINIFKSVNQLVEDKIEKGILTKDEVIKLINNNIYDTIDRLSVLFGLLCGMRLGEVRGIQYGDISGNEIHICHNWQDMEGMKEPVCGSERIVPLPQEINKLIKSIYNNNPNSLIFPNRDDPTMPRSNGYFRLALTRELEYIGIDKDEQFKRNITFQSLRHTFITLGRMAGITDIEIMALAGHKSKISMDRLSHAEKIMDILDASVKLDEFVSNDNK
jgi:integrase